METQVIAVAPTKLVSNLGWQTCELMVDGKYLNKWMNNVRACMQICGCDEQQADAGHLSRGLPHSSAGGPEQAMEHCQRWALQSYIACGIDIPSRFPKVENRFCSVLT